MALRGLERFTALEAEVDFDGSSMSCGGRSGRCAPRTCSTAGRGRSPRRGVNVVAVNSLRGIEFARVWILGATERAFPPPVRQDPILLDDERETISQRARRRSAAGGARQRGGARRF